MTTAIAASFIDQGGTLTVSCSSEPGDTNLRLSVDGKDMPGHFVGTAYGYLYQDPDGTWGVKGVHWGVHTLRVLYDTKATNGVGSDIPTPHPNAALIGPQLTVPQAIDAAYRGGFHTEDGLTAIVSLEIQESGLFTRARNWHPELGFRLRTEIVGVQGPSIVWNDFGCQCHSDRGILQYYSLAHPEISDATADDPVQAAQHALTLSAGGTDFHIWAAWDASKAHYDQAVQGWPAVRPLVKTYLASK